MTQLNRKTKESIASAIAELQQKLADAEVADPGQRAWVFADIYGLVTYASPSACELLGKTPNELVGEPVPGRDVVDRAVGKERVYTRRINVDGKWFWARAIPLHQSCVVRLFPDDRVTPS